MSEPINVNGPSGFPELDLLVQPPRITMGGIVLLTLTPPAGTYTVKWTVQGPVPLSIQDTRIALLGATTVTGGEVTVQRAGDPVRATLDTSPLAVGSWRVRVELTRVTKVHSDKVHSDEVHSDEDSAEARRPDRNGYFGEADFEVLPRPFAAGDDVAVTLKRTAVPATTDQALWVAIRRSTNAISFENYSRFLDFVLCGNRPDGDGGTYGRAHDRAGGRAQHKLAKVERRTALPFPNVERYRLLKAATEVFLMVNCGVDLGDFRGVDLAEESRRLNRPVQPGDLEAQLRAYLTSVPTDDGRFLDVLPYLGLVRLQLRDVAVVGPDFDEEAAEICFGIIAEKLTNPCFIELIWSYWGGEESGAAQALSAICWRFQNRTAGGPGRDPMSTLDIDPLRPLNNLLWGWIQDQQHRLSPTRRAYEYDHQYGLMMSAQAPVRGADSRSRFIEAFHHLLSVCATFFERDDDATVLADGFIVLNALKETHLVLTEGSHNQYGDLPWTARHEMLMTQWIMSRPEMRDFLPTRVMVAYPESWMHQVEAVNKLHAWTDVSVLHFRDLAVFGEQLLLSVRFGAWSDVNEPEQAANWARYWRPELQRYTHAYRVVTGIDLTRRADGSVPAFWSRRRPHVYRG